MNSKQTEGRNQTDANVYIDRAIAMLKDLPEIRESETVAGYNGVVSLLQYAQESHTASLPSKPVGDVSSVMMEDSPESRNAIADLKSGYAAAPQKGIPDEIYNDIADFFKYAKHRGPYTIQKYGGSMIVKFMDGAKAKCSIQMWQGEEVTLNDSPKNS